MLFILHNLFLEIIKSMECSNRIFIVCHTLEVGSMIKSDLFNRAGIECSLIESHKGDKEAIRLRGKLD